MLVERVAIFPGWPADWAAALPLPAAEPDVLLWDPPEPHAASVSSAATLTAVSPVVLDLGVVRAVPDPVLMSASGLSCPLRAFPSPRMPVPQNTSWAGPR